jgi:membrane-bound ClpP family serine protease
MDLFGASPLQLGTIGAFTLLAVFVVVLAAILVYFIVWALKRKPVTGSEALIGKTGIALTDMTLGREGEVMIDGIVWKAKIGDNSSGIGKEEPVVVIGISALTLLVGKDKPQPNVPRSN